MWASLVKGALGCLRTSSEGLVALEAKGFKGGAGWFQGWGILVNLPTQGNTFAADLPELRSFGAEAGGFHSANGL